MECFIVHESLMNYWQHVLHPLFKLYYVLHVYIHTNLAVNIFATNIHPHIQLQTSCVEWYTFSIIHIDASFCSACLPQPSPLDLLLIIANIHHYISTILATFLTTSFTIILIGIFFIIFHYHLKMFGLCFYQCHHSTFYMFNMNIYIHYASVPHSLTTRKNYLNMWFDNLI